MLAKGWPNAVLVAGARAPRDDGSPAIAGRVSGEEGSDTQVQFLPSQLLKLE